MRFHESVRVFSGLYLIPLVLLLFHREYGVDVVLQQLVRQLVQTWVVLDRRGGGEEV